MAISLNSTSKYKSRILPQVLSYYEKKGKFPKGLVFAMASIIRFFKGNRDGEKIELNDEQKFLNLYKKVWEEFSGDYNKLVDPILSLEDYWWARFN